MKESTIKTVKGVVTAIGGIGVSAIVVNAVKHVNPTNGTGAIMRLCTLVGTAMFSGLASDACCKYTSEKIDETLEKVEIKVDKEEEVPENSQEVGES